MICFLFPPFDSFLSEPLWDFIDEVNGCRYSFIREAFPANYSFTERKNLQEMHFKLSYQARQQTFASDKTKAGAAGMKLESGKR